MKTLICASNYTGSWKVYQSMNDAMRMKNILRDFYLQTDIILSFHLIF